MNNEEYLFQLVMDEREMKKWNEKNNESVSV